MSENAELRKLSQDLIAPDLKAFSTDLAACKSGTKKQFATMKRVAQARYEVLLAKPEALDAKHTANHSQILKALDIDKRMESLRLLFWLQRQPLPGR